METPKPADFPKYVETATKTAATFLNDLNDTVGDVVVDTTNRAQEQYSVLFEQAQGLVTGGYKTAAESYKTAAAKVDVDGVLDGVPGADTVRPYIEQAGKAAERAAERLTVPTEWVDTYFDLANKVIEGQRHLTDRVMDNQRQFADRVLVTTAAGTATAEKATTAAKKTATGTKSTAKKATSSTKSAAKKTTKKTTKKASKASKK